MVIIIAYKKYLNGVQLKVSGKLIMPVFIMIFVCIIIKNYK